MTRPPKTAARPKAKPGRFLFEIVLAGRPTGTYVQGLGPCECGHGCSYLSVARGDGRDDILRRVELRPCDEDAKAMWGLAT